MSVSIDGIDLKFNRSGNTTTLLVRSIVWSDSSVPPSKVIAILDDMPSPDGPEQQIALEIRGQWAAFFYNRLQQSDQLEISRCLVRKRDNAHTNGKYQLQLDDSRGCKNARVVLRSARDRIVSGPGEAVTWSTVSSTGTSAAGGSAGAGGDGGGNKKKKKKGAKRGASQGAAAAASSGSAAGQASKRPRVVEEYLYTPLGELKPNREANIYGVVTNFTLPRTTKVGDRFVSLTITDRSLGGRSVVMNAFQTSDEKLPRVARVGDILRAHRVQVRTWSGSIQLTLPKSKGSWVSIDGNTGRSTEPYAKSTQNASEVDREAIVALRSFIAESPLPVLNPEFADRASTVGQIPGLLSSGSKIDIICRVIGVTRPPRGRKGSQLHPALVVWDGSTSIDGERGENSVVSLDKNDCDALDPSEMSDHGVLVPVQIDPAAFETTPVGPGDWVHIRNLQTRELKDGLCGYSDDIRLLCESLRVCREIETGVDQAAKSGAAGGNRGEAAPVDGAGQGSARSAGKAQVPAVITRRPSTAINEAPDYLTTIKAMQSRHAPTPGRFAIRAKVRGYHPRDVKRWCRRDNGKYIFVFSLELADPTGSQEVIVSLQDAEYFLSVKACDLSKKRQELVAVKRCINFLMDPANWGFFIVQSVQPPGAEKIYLLSSTRILNQAPGE